MAMNIIPSLWFDRVAREAVQFYVSIFDDAETLFTSHYPKSGLADWQAEFAGKELEIRFRIANLEFSAINAGSEFRINPSISMIVNFDPSDRADVRADLEAVWHRLASEGSVVRMELGEYPFASLYGWVEDRYGLNWQLMVTNPEGEPRPFITPQLMFTGEVPQALAARDLYMSLFLGSGEGVTRMADDGSVMYCDFQLTGQWFSAMDSLGPQHDFTFNQGLSLIAECDTQEEIDRLWEALSSDSDAEVCGWCRDRFGMNWQIVPSTQFDPLDDPERFMKLIEMKKIIIEDLEG